MTDRSTFYDTIASDYDRLMSTYEIEKRLRIISEDLLPERLDGCLVLDGGSGTGWFTKQLASQGAEVVAVDIGHALLQETAKKQPNALLAQNSLVHLGFASNTFDVVISTEVIEHTPDPRSAVKELVRVLKPGGILIITVPNRVWHISVNVASLLGVRHYKGFENWVWRSQLKRWLQESDVVLESMIGFNLFPLFYKPFYRILDFADRLRFLHPLMVNIGLRARKGTRTR